jgi:hypothetical protein
VRSAACPRNPPQTSICPATAAFGGLSADGLYDGVASTVALEMETTRLLAGTSTTFELQGGADRSTSQVCALWTSWANEVAGFVHHGVIRLPFGSGGRAWSSASRNWKR